MKILYAAGLYMPASGGGELSMYTLLRYLARRGHTIVVVTGPNDLENPHDDKRDLNVLVERVLPPEQPSQAFDRVFEKHRDIAVLVTQSLWCDKAIHFGQRKGIPTIYFLRSAFGELDVSTDGAYTCEFVVANSKTVKDYLECRWGRRDAVVVPPTIDLSQYLVSYNTRQCITIINPLDLKGGHIFRAIAQRLPNRPFLAVEGWVHLKDGQRWSKRKLRDLSASYGLQTSYVPNEVSFTDIPNVRVHASVADMRIIYGQTRLLLIPSIVPEGGPRVAVEAMVNGIPVIGSALGEVPTTVGAGGETVSDPADIDAWVGAIGRFDDPDYYTERSHQAQLQASRYDLEAAAAPLLRILAEIEGRGFP